MKQNFIFSVNSNCTLLKTKKKVLYMGLFETLSRHFRKSDFSEIYIYIYIRLAVEKKFKHRIKRCEIRQCRLFSRESMASS